MAVDLSTFNNSSFNTGRPFLIRLLWYFINALVLVNPINPSSHLKVIVLRLFGAQLGKGVVLKPSINVKYPWNLTIGDHSWIGERVWLDSLAPISIGRNVCISQGVYLCTGNHDWTDSAFGLITKPITIRDGAWVGARTIVMPGVTVDCYSVITAGAIITKDTESYMVYAGNPATAVKARVFRQPKL